MKFGVRIFYHICWLTGRDGIVTFWRRGQDEMGFTRTGEHLVLAAQSLL